MATSGRHIARVSARKRRDLVSSSTYPVDERSPRCQGTKGTLMALEVLKGFFETAEPWPSVRYFETTSCELHGARGVAPICG